MIKIIDKMTFDTYKDSKIWRIIVNILESLLSIFCHKKQSKNDIDLAIKYNKFINSIKPLELDNFDSHNEWKNFVNNVLYLSKSKSINTFLTWKPITSSMNVTNSYFLKYEFDYLKNTENWGKLWQILLKKRNNLVEYPFIFSFKYTGNFIHFGYLLEKYIQFSGIDFKNISYIFEFGGGYGAMATIIHRLGFNGKYFIYDFELFTQLQKYFLESEGLKIIDNVNENNGIYCYSKFNNLNIKNLKGKKVFIATWSISEAPLSIRKDYLNMLDKITLDFDYFILGFQNTFGEVDNVVFFEEFKNRYKNIKWHIESVHYLPQHNLFFGFKK